MILHKRLPVKYYSIALLLTLLPALLVTGCDKSKSASATQSSNEALTETPEAAAAESPSVGEGSAENAPAKEVEEEKPAAPKVIDGEFYSVFSFIDNRPFAHALEGEMTVAQASSDAFTRNIWGEHMGEWKTKVSIDGQKVIALDKRRDGSLSIPSPTPEPNALVLRLYNPVDNAKNKLSVKLNGKALEPKELAKGWSVVVWKLKDQGALENRIDLEFSGLGRIDGALSGGAIATVEIGTLDHASFNENVLKSLDPKKPFGTDVPLATEQGPLSLKQKNGAMWFFYHVPKTLLHLKVKGGKGCGLHLEVAQATGKKLSTPLKKELKLTEGQTVATFELKAPQYAGSRLLIHPSDSTQPECDSMTIESLDLVAKGKEPKRKTFEPPKHILVWMIDTLRSDHLPIHFTTDVHAPNLKKLASEGASFKWAIVQGNESKTSHASFFTGMYPDKHRVLTHGTLKPYMELLPETLQSMGYTTGAYIANGYISKPWGFVQGWNFYRNNLREQKGITAAALRLDASGWMEKNADKKFFMYVGTIDPHVSYRAHEGLIEKYADPNYKGPYKDSCSGEVLGKIKSNPEKVSPEDRKQIEALYKNEIEYNDQEFGKLRAFMEEKGLWKNTMVVITADHGDEFWEHGSVGHGQSAYDELVHVPIIMYYPPAIEAGVTPESGVDVLDIYPTIIDIAGGKPPKDAQGHSLLPLMDSKAIIYPEVGLATKYLSHYALQVGHWSYLLRKGDSQLFDNATDLNEQTDVASKHPFITRALTDSISWFLLEPKEWQKLTWGTLDNLSPNFLKLLQKSRASSK